MPSSAVQVLLEHIQKSGLIEPGLLRRSIDELRNLTGGKLPPDPKEVGAYFVDQSLLTDWQLEKLLAGRNRGFFLGKYRLLRHLGRGGMGSVYLAEHTGMLRQVAIKVLPREIVHDKSYLERFQREARVAASLDHPNIVRAFDFDQADNQTYYLVMEFVDGQNLAHLVRTRPTPLEVSQVVHYLRQAAAGLQHAHDRGIIHRDIKPSNLLIDRQDCLKILDLGLARYAAHESGSLTEIHHENVLGTADYMSPEQALNSRAVDTRTDIYSLGCTLYFALAGHPPFPEGTLAQRIAQHQSAEAVPLQSLRPDVPDELAAVCQKMMRKRPEERYQTARDVEWALAAFCPRSTDVAMTHGAIEYKNWSEGPRPVPPATIVPIVVNDGQHRELRRVRRSSSVSRPPIGLWLTMILMLALIVVLVWAVFGQR